MNHALTFVFGIAVIKELNHDKRLEKKIGNGIFYESGL